MYATRDDMVMQFGEREVIQLTDRAEPATDEIDEAVLNRALLAASSEVDGYVAGRFTTPLPNPSEGVKQMVCDIARYRLSSAGSQTTDGIVERYRAAIAYFKNAAQGLVTLGTPGGADAGTTGRVRVARQDSIFGRHEGAI